MKKTLSLICLAAIIISAFCACTHLPDEPATTAVKTFEVSNGIGENEPSTEKAPTVVEGTVKPTSAPTEIKTEKAAALAIPDMDFVLSDYYIYNKSCVKIKDIEMTDYGLGFVECYAKLELSDIAFGEDSVRVGALYYDDDGEVVKTSFLLCDIKNGNHKEGEVVDCRFDIPDGYNIAKIAFVDYAEVSDQITI